MPEPTKKGRSVDSEDAISMLPEAATQKDPKQVCCTAKMLVMRCFFL